ncbi:MAG: hypothetical protein AAFP04_03525 [Myxococcota bacterium]
MIGESRSTWVSTPARLIVLLATITLLVFTFTKHRVGANVLSRFVTVERLIEAGTWSHDGSPLGGSVDAVQVDGRTYSSKPPTYSLLLAITAWPLRRITGTPIDKAPRAYLHALVFIHQVIPYVLLLYLGLRWIEAKSDDRWLQAVFLAGLSFAAMPFGYAVTLNNHTPTAFYLFLMWWLADRSLRDGGAVSHLRAIGVGVLGGLAASHELTAGIFTPLMSVLFARRNLAAGALVILAAVVATIPMFAVYYAISGSVVPFYIRPELYDYPGSYWRNPTGLDGLNDPLWLYAFHAFLGHHGLFSLTPYVLIGVAGALVQARRRDPMAWVILAGASIVVTYILYKTNNYGGRTIGMRWFAQFVPLFAVAAVPALEWLRTRSWGRMLVYSALGISAVLIVEALVHNTFSPGGWVYGVMKTAGVTIE